MNVNVPVIRIALISVILTLVAGIRVPALPQQASESHHVMLRVVRVTPDWMSFSGYAWATVVMPKEGEFHRYFEVAIWEETSSVHFYAFPDGIGNRELENEMKRELNRDLTEQELINLREQYLISNYVGMPEAWTEERSEFLKSAFMDIASRLVSLFPDSHHHIIYSGHGGPGGRLFEAQLSRPDAFEFLKSWSASLGRPLGVMDMGGPCTKGSFADLETFCESTSYFIASDMNNGGYTMDDWTIEKWYEVSSGRQYHNLFSTNMRLEEALKDRIDLTRKRYEYSRANMTTSRVEQANYLYSCEAFKQFSPNFKSFLGETNLEYRIWDDLYQYMLENKAPTELIEQFNNIIVHRADNRDFFEWDLVRNGLLMPESSLLEEIRLRRRNAALPDFDGDGTVGFSDFLQFAERFGSSRGDTDYDIRYDLDGDDTVGFGDFVIFAASFGKAA